MILFFCVSLSLSIGVVLGSILTSTKWADNAEEVYSIDGEHKVIHIEEYEEFFIWRENHKIGK